MEFQLQLVDRIPTIHKSAEIVESYFGISEQDSAHILNILRSKLYTNKPLAVVREYSTNAWDEHNKLGFPERSIEVTIPSVINPIFSVRDFGNGLDETVIREIYTKYGRSTKRDTNEAVGCLGLGCKAAFGYSDSFTIVSIYNYMEIRLKDTYTAYIDETKIGRIAKMNSEETEEETGIMIVVPVKLNDIDLFVKGIQSTFRYWNIKPIILGGKIEWAEEKKYFEGSNWWLADNPGGPDNQGYIIMGQVPYPLDANALNLQEPKLLSIANCHQLRIVVDIGSVSIAANREGLEYDEHTKRQIKRILTKIYAEIGEAVQKTIDMQSSLIDAKLKHRQLYQNIPWFIDRDITKYKYKDMVLNDKLILASPSVIISWIYTVGYSNRVKKTVLEYEYNKNGIAINSVPWQVNHNKNMCIVINDIGRSFYNYVKEFIKTKKEDIIVLTVSPVPDENLDKFLELNKDLFRDFKPIYGSEIVVAKAAKAKIVNNIDTKKYTVNCFKLKMDKSNVHIRAKSEYWEATTLPDEPSAYIYIDRFCWIPDITDIDKKFSTNQLFGFLATLKLFDFDIKEIYAVRPETEISKDWVELSQYVLDKIMKDISNNEIIVKKNKYEAIQHFEGAAFDLTLKYRKTIKHENSLSKLIDIVEEWSSYKDIVKKYRDLLTALETYGFIVDESEIVEGKEILKAGEIIQQLQKDLNNKYPLNNCCSACFNKYYANGDSILTNIDYINIVDEYNEMKKNKA